jgi:hypothetical protein
VVGPAPVGDENGYAPHRARLVRRSLSLTDGSKRGPPSLPG